MKGVRNSVVLLAASVVMTGAAPTPDKSAAFDQAMQAFPSASITLDLKREPQLVLGTSTRITGLIVDCASPQRTWSMLNPSVPARNPQASLPPQKVLPVQAPRAFSSNLAVHEPDFAVIQLSFR